MTKRVVLMASIILTIISINFKVYAVNYGWEGYWYEQWSAWSEMADKNRNIYIYATNPNNGDYVGKKYTGEAAAIIANLTDQTIEHLSKKDRVPYIKLLNAVIEDLGELKDNNEGESASNYKKILAKYKKKQSRAKEVFKNTTDKELKKALDITDKTIKETESALDAHEKFQNSINSGDDLTDEEATEAADAIDDANNDGEEKTDALILGKRDLGYVETKEKDKEITVDRTIENADNFEQAGEAVKSADKRLSKTVKSLYNILLAVAIVVAVIIGTYLSIKLIMSSVEGKAKIKEMFVPYVIGCVVAFGAFGIWSMVMSVLNSL